MSFPAVDRICNTFITLRTRASKESPYNFINVLGSFSVILQMKLDLPILLVLVRQREKSQKFFELWSFN